MEKTKIVNNTKISPFSNKDKVANKIESLWTENSTPHKNSNNQNKKLEKKLKRIVS